MTYLGEYLGMVAPYYNLVFVAIVIALFIFFFKREKRIYLKPWKLIFCTISIYVVEEVLTVLDKANIIDLSVLVAPILEMAMITIVIYALLSQQEWIKKNVKQ